MIYSIDMATMKLEKKGNKYVGKTWVDFYLEVDETDEEAAVRDTATTIVGSFAKAINERAEMVISALKETAAEIGRNCYLLDDKGNFNDRN